MGNFRCPYAPEGLTRCPASICDCFIDTHPDSPFGLHPEAFLVNGHQYDLNGHTATCPGCLARGSRTDENGGVMSTFQPGDWVVYRPYPGAPAEDGEVTEVRGDLVMVRYRGDLTAKATRPADLERGA